MNKWHYTLLIFFLMLTAFSGLLENTIRFLLGPQIFTLDSFYKWLLAMSIVSLIGSILTLKYYYYQKHRFAFTAGIASMSLNFIYAIVIITPGLFDWLFAQKRN